MFPALSFDVSFFVRSAPVGAILEGVEKDRQCYVARGWNDAAAQPEPPMVEVACREGRLTRGGRKETRRPAHELPTRSLPCLERIAKEVLLELRNREYASVGVTHQVESLGNSRRN